MIGKFFKKPTAHDLLEELRSSTLKESKVDSIVQYVDINHPDQTGQNLLHLMAEENKIESVKWLLKNNINFNAYDAKGNTALMIASKNGFLEAVDELIKKGAKVNIENNSGYTAIEFAIFNNYYEVYKLLKPKVIDINRKNKKNENLIQIAIKAKNIQVIDDLFYDDTFKINKDILFFKDSFSDKNILNTILSQFEDYNVKDVNNRNILFYVVENGSETQDVLLNLLEQGLDINCIDKEGNNILLHLLELITLKENSLQIDTTEDIKLHKNEMKKLYDLIPILIENEIDTKVCNNKNQTILSIPTLNKNLHLLNIILDSDVDIDIKNKDNQTALSLVATKGLDYIETIYLLLDYGANPNIKDNENKTVIEKLITASLIVKEGKKAKTSQKQELNFKTDYTAILESVLVNTDANLSQYSSLGEPYFFDALRHGSIDIVKLLMKHGADVNQVDKEGNNIIYKYMDENLHFRKESEQKEFHSNLQTIIMMGANVNAKDSFGGITLHKAILNCDAAVIKMLLHSGANMNAIDNRGRHILHNSIWKNNSKIFRLVYSYNKSLLNLPDKFGVMPINYAAFLGYTDLVLEFIEMNAHVNNPYKKTKYILNFLKKFHKNLKQLVDNARTKVEKDKLNILVTNMKKEFEVEN